MAPCRARRGAAATGEAPPPVPPPAPCPAAGPSGPAGGTGADRAAAAAGAARPRRLDPPGPVDLDRRSWLRLRRGSYPIDARLDLHGLTQAEAHARLAAFLAGAQARGNRCVLVITGRGLRHGGTLRAMTPRWLETEPNRAACSASPRPGCSMAARARSTCCCAAARPVAAVTGRRQHSAVGATRPRQFSCRRANQCRQNGARGASIWLAGRAFFCRSCC